MNNRFFAYITQYALTAGIERREVRDCFDLAPDMVADIEHSNLYYHGSDWHRTFRDALDQAEALRAKKIASLKKQIAKLERMTFTEPKEARP